MNVQIKEINKDQLSLIKTLWQKLNEIHLNDSIHFKDHFRNFTFDDRFDKYFQFDDDNINIEIIMDNELSVGYCISVIEQDVGEIMGFSGTAFGQASVCGICYRRYQDKRTQGFQVRGHHE